MSLANYFVGIIKNIYAPTHVPTHMFVQWKTWQTQACRPTMYNVNCKCYGKPRWTCEELISITWLTECHLVQSRQFPLHVVQLIAVKCIGLGAQSTLGGTTFLPEKYVWKITKMPEFYMTFTRKMLEFYIVIARKYFQNLRGHMLPLPPPSPTPI